MANAVLVSLDVAAGEKALEVLANAGVSPTVALLAKTSDYDLPRLFVASPEFDALSKLEAHGRIADAVQPAFSWSAPKFVVLRLNNKFISALRAIFSKTADVHGMRLGGQQFGNTFIEDAYVYQIR